MADVSEVVYENLTHTEALTGKLLSPVQVRMEQRRRAKTQRQPRPSDPILAAPFL